MMPHSTSKQASHPAARGHSAWRATLVAIVSKPVGWRPIEGCSSPRTTAGPLTFLRENSLRRREEIRHLLLQVHSRPVSGEKAGLHFNGAEPEVLVPSQYHIAPIVVNLVANHHP